MNTYIYSQEVVHIKERDFDGFIFPKEFAIWGFPPSSNRYTLNENEVKLAEDVLQANIKNICFQILNRKHSKSYSKRFMKKYIRQYVGYVSDDGHVIIKIILYRLSKDEIKCDIKSDIFWKQFTEDVVQVYDGGYSYGSIYIDLTNKDILEVNINGMA